MLINCFYTSKDPLERYGKVHSLIVEVESIPRIGETLEIDNVEWEVSSIVYHVVKTAAGNNWVSEILVNLK
jgi:hypothetical protein